MGNIVVCARGGKPVYITEDVKEWIGFSIREVWAVPPALIAPHLATAQKIFQRELVKSAGQPFHSYRYESVLRRKDGGEVRTHNTVCIIRTTADSVPLVVSVIRPCCAEPLLDEVAEHWPHLSEASAELVLRIVRSLAHFAV